MKIVKIFGRFFYIIFTVLLSLLLIFNLITMVMRIVTGKSYATVFGITTAIVITGSMEPTISINDMVIIKEQNGYMVNDIITYLSDNGSLVTHRLIETTNDGYITKGDFNNTVDTEAPISEDKVVGKVILTIPKIGLVIGYLKTPLGMLCITFFVFFLIRVPSIFLSVKTGGRKEHEGE
jgi:signal peptidase